MSRRKRRVTIPAVLEQLTQALQQQSFHDAAGSASALRAFAELAAVEVPARGAFAADNPELYQPIEAVANRCLRFVRARRQFSTATAQVDDLELREKIPSTAIDVQSVGARAYFYAGVAFGVTLSTFGRPS